MDDTEDTRRLAREVAELDEDILSFLGIEFVSIDIAQYRELLIETMGIVLGEIGVEDSASFFYEERSLFTIDELSDIFFCFGCCHKREPNWFWFPIFVGDDLDTLTVV